MSDAHLFFTRSELMVLLALVNEGAAVLVAKEPSSSKRAFAIGPSWVAKCRFALLAESKL